MPHTLYPRATLRKIIKAHSGRGVSRDVDILIFLQYAIFMRELIKEAGIAAKMAGERGVTARSVRKVRRRCLMRFKG